MNQLLSKVLDAHGGLDTWKKYSIISPTLTFGGLAFKSKLNNQGLTKRTLNISTTMPRVVFNDYPSIGFSGIFTKDKVWIETEKGGVTSLRENPRDAFKTFRHNFYWDDLDLLYFAGYASWNYFNSPFLLSYPGVEVEELDLWNENNEEWYRLSVKFPATIPTHSNHQVFYFDKNFQMRRFDYCPEVFAKWARGAHYCSHYLNWNGITIPSKRKVVPNGPDNKSKNFPTLVWIKVSNVKFE
ncbi:MAG: hypothetical protein RIA63_07805 [Cyclobacteriaceae bacterium]